MPVARHQNHHNEPLPLDLETAPDEPPRLAGYRGFVGGVLYIEGFVLLAMGGMLMTGYWPPISVGTVEANPISQLGMWIVIAALSYMIIVGLIIFFYNLFHPHTRHLRRDPHPDGAVIRARRYAGMKRRTYYIFDSTITCQADAEDAMRARELY